MTAATTVTTTWPSTTLAASRLAWGNSRVTTTLLLQVDNPRTRLARANRRLVISDVRKLFWPATTYGALAKGRALYTPTPAPSRTKPGFGEYPAPRLVSGASSPRNISHVQGLRRFCRLALGVCRCRRTR